MTAFFDILLGGVFHAAVLFLVAAGLQLVFGVQKIVNLACGSFYALGAYFGISSVNWALAAGIPPWMFLPVLIASGILLGAILHGAHGAAFGYCIRAGLLAGVLLGVGVRIGRREASLPPP